MEEQVMMEEQTVRVLIQRLHPGPTGIDLSEVWLPRGATTAEAASTAGMGFLGYNFIVNGAWAGINETIKDGDIILMVPRSFEPEPPTVSNEMQAVVPSTEEELDNRFITGQVGMREYAYQLAALQANQPTQARVRIVPEAILTDAVLKAA